MWITKIANHMTDVKHIFICFTFSLSTQNSEGRDQKQKLPAFRLIFHRQLDHFAKGLDEDNLSSVGEPPLHQQKCLH